MKKVFNRVDELVGNTPLFRLEAIEKEYGLKAKLYGKLEYLNATGSIKDRIAKQMILDAQDKGLLKKGSVIIEPTSGNTGIGLAAIGTSLGYRVIIVMPDSFSVERRKMIKGYGGEVVLSEGAKGMAGAIEKANELAKEFESAFIPGQFENPSNWKAHYLSTGKEIYEDLDGEVDVLVAGVGTGGTITGTGKYLKEQNSNIEVVAIEPETSNVLSGGKAGKHAIQGIGAGFIPKVLDTDIYDKIITIDNKECIEVARKIGELQGLLLGISSGAALAGAIKLAKQEEYNDKNIVVILPDSGDRYLSTEMFED